MGPVFGAAERPRREPAGIAPVSVWLPSRHVAGLATAPSAAGSRHSLLPAGWLAGLLLLAIALAFGPDSLAASLASAPVILALLLAGALGSSAVAGKLGGIVAVLIGPPARYGLLATASRTPSGRPDQPNRPTVR